MNEESVRKQSKKTDSFVFFALLAIVLALAIKVPGYNWDMLGYVGSVKSYQGLDNQELHSYVYQNLKSATNQEIHDIYLEAPRSDYQKTMAENANFFAQQLPFYQIRVLYNSAILLFEKIGINPFTASHLISALSVLIAALLIQRMLFAKTTSRLKMFFPVVASYFGLLQVARLSTPDGLAFLLIILMGFLFYQNRIRTAFILMPVLILVRTDLILLLIPLGLYGFLINPQLRIPSFFSGVVSAALFVFLNQFFENYGWHTIFYFSFIEQIPNPAEIDLSVTFKQYLFVFTKGVKEMFTDRSSAIYLFLSIVILEKQIRQKIGFQNLKKDGLVVFHYIGLVYFLLHFFLFPVAWKRFFVGPYIITLILFFSEILGKKINPKKSGEEIEKI